MEPHVGANSFTSGAMAKASIDRLDPDDRIPRVGANDDRRQYRRALAAPSRWRIVGLGVTRPIASRPGPSNGIPRGSDLILRSDRGVTRLAPFWSDIEPGLNEQNTLFTAGLYTVTPDHKPSIGKAPGLEGLFLNTGYSGHGIMGSPSG